MFGTLRPLWRYLLYRLRPDDPCTTVDRRLEVAGVDSAVEILFDVHGVPHIRAQNEPDLFFGLGYMHGRDRRFQMEVLRALALGELRALFGSGTIDAGLLEREVLHRMLGFGRRALEALEQASAADAALLQGYAAGVNAATGHEPLPLEFRLLGTEPAPWQAHDGLAVMQLLAFALSKNWDMELARLQIALFQLAAGHPLQRAFEIWPPRQDFPPHAIGPCADAASFTRTVLAPELEDYLQAFRHVYAGSAPGKAAEPAPDVLAASMLPQGGGSNNWALSGHRTKHGAAVLCADPHLPLGLPAHCYLAHLECADDDQCAGARDSGYAVIGAGYPGTPGIFFGTNGRAAWGVTANWVDVTDLYVEKPDPLRPGHYLCEGESLPFERVVESFRIGRRRGSGGTTSPAPEETREVRRTRHGVVLNDILAGLPAGFPLVTLQRDDALGTPVSSLRALYRAGDHGAASRALATLDAMPGHWVVADRAGGIGYQSTGRIPKRRSHRGTFPAPGWLARFDWTGWISGEALPRLSNPPEGTIATANNQVASPDALGYPFNDEGDAGWRVQRILSLLGRGTADRQGGLLEHHRATQLDAVEPLWALLLPLWQSALTRAAAGRDAGLAQAAGLLLGWDGACTPDSAAAPLFHALCVQLLCANLQGEMPPATLEFVRRYLNAEPLVSWVLGSRSVPGWNTEERVLDALRTALHRLSARHGSDPRAWSWRRAAPFELRHPFGGRRLLAGYCNRGPLPTRGSHNAVNKQYVSRADEDIFPVSMAAALRINVDLGNLAASTMHLPGGQSGRPGSVHYDDLLAGYLQGTGASMSMDFAEIRSRATGSLRLQPLP